MKNRVICSYYLLPLLMQERATRMVRYPRSHFSSSTIHFFSERVGHSVGTGSTSRVTTSHSTPTTPIIIRTNTIQLDSISPLPTSLPLKTSPARKTVYYNFNCQCRHLSSGLREEKAQQNYNNTRADPPVPGKAVIGDLLRSNRLLIPIAIDANGRLGPMFQYTLYGTITIPPPIPPRKQFKLNRPYAKAMYKQATSIPAPCGILLEADNNWKHTQKTQNHTTILWSLIYGSNTIYHYNPTNRYWHRTRSQLFNLESNPKL